MATRRRKNTQSPTEEVAVTVTEDFELIETTEGVVAPAEATVEPAEEPEVIAEEPQKEEKTAPVTVQVPAQPKKAKPSRHPRNIPRFSAHK